MSSGMSISQIISKWLVKLHLSTYSLQYLFMIIYTGKLYEYIYNYILTARGLDGVCITVWVSDFFLKDVDLNGYCQDAVLLHLSLFTYCWFPSLYLMCITDIKLFYLTNSLIFYLHICTSTYFVLKSIYVHGYWLESPSLYKCVFLNFPNKKLL